MNKISLILGLAVVGLWAQTPSDTTESHPESQVALFAQVGGTDWYHSKDLAFSAGALGWVKDLSPWGRLALGLSFSSQGHRACDTATVDVTSYDALAAWEYMNIGSWRAEWQWLAGYGKAVVQSNSQTDWPGFLSLQTALALNYVISPKWLFGINFGWHQAVFYNHAPFDNFDLSGPSVQLGIRWQP